MLCPNCGFDSPPEMRFCGLCGTRLAVVCPSCGFANPPAFHFCGQCGTRLSEPSTPVQPLEPQPAVEAVVASRPVSVQLEGERRLATVILADVTGSTDLMEQIGTEAWVEVMNRVFHILESEIYRFGGAVDQFRGDGLVAFFGAASAHEDDPERAVLAGLAMQQALEPYAAELIEREGIDLRLRVGVNTGEVIVASVGDRRQYSEDTAMGEAVALAARMETAAEPGTVLVSESTYRLVGPRFEWEPLGEVTVKGVSHPLAVYRPLAPRADARQPYRLQDFVLSVPLIGRGTEFTVIKDRTEGLRAGRGGIVMVMGDEGMGKSFLVSQVRQHLVREHALLAGARASDPSSDDLSPLDLAWLQGRCRSYGQSSPYSMWLDLLGSWLGVREGEPKVEIRDRLRRQAEALWGDRLTEHYPYLATFLSLPLEETFAERVRHLDTEGVRQQFLLADGATPASGPGGEVSDGLRQQFFLMVRSWVEALARRGPLALAFEDLHWADVTSLELLEYCLPLCDREPLLWLFMFRPDRTSSAWEFRHRVETQYPHRMTAVTLPPLTEAQSCEFVEQLIGSEVLTAKTCALIVDRAEGNPYYIAELTRSLIEQGVLVQDVETSQWRATRAVTSLDLPDSLQSLLEARVDRWLSPQERHVLQMAAVIGQVFWSEVLQALGADATALGAAAIRGHLTALQRAGLIQERGQVPDLGMEYAFKSTLIRDVAYESLLSAQRAVYHLKVAEYLEELSGPETWAQHYGGLAYHYRQAGGSRKELFYTIQAAEQARGVYANAEALEYYTRALELLGGMEVLADGENQRYAIRTQRFEVLNGRREVLFLMGDFEAGEADARALLPLARQLDDDPAWLIDALLQQPGVAGWRSKEELDAGIPMAQEALDLARQLGDQRREMQSLIAVARQRYWVNDPTGREVAERALELARRLGDQRYEVSILTAIGQVYAWRDQPERSVEYLETALPISQALDDRGAQLDLLSLIGVQLESSDDYYRRLVECHEEQLRISREIGHRPAEAQALMFCGQIRGLYLGDYEGGLALLEDSLRAWEGMPGVLYPLLRIVQIQVVQGRYDEAQTTLERARRVGEQHTAQIGLAGLDLVSAILYNALGSGRTSDARAHLQMALDLATRNREVFVESPQTSRQYQMAAACEAAAAHIGLAQAVAGEADRRVHLRQALESSQAALEMYEVGEYVRPIECVSEEILYRHSLALAANGREAEAAGYLQRAYDDMMHKHGLIPPDTPFRRTYLESIPLHRDIRAAYIASQEASLTGQ